MAEQIIKEIKTRIALRTGDYNYWTTGAGKDIELYKGEVCVCTVDSADGQATTAPTVLFKVANANGQKFADLKWVSALAADVYEWAKHNEVKVTGAGNAVTNVAIETAEDGQKYLTFKKETVFATKAELDAALDAFGGDIAAITDNDHQYTFEIVNGKLEVKATNYVNGEKGETTSVATLDFITPAELNDILTTDYYTKIELTDKIHTTDEIKAMEIAHATAAGKVDNALTVKVGGSDVVFDGSVAKTADVDAAIAAAIEAEGHPEYSIAKVTTTTGYSATYQLTKDGTAVGAKIDIPKDMVVSKGEVITYENAGAWGDAGTYIVLTLANATNDTLYIPAAGLIEYVTSGSTADSQVIVAIDESTHKVTATIGAGKVGTTELADGAVTTAKLANGAVTNEKLADNSVNTDEIMDGAITIAKFAGDVSARFGEIDTGISDNAAAIAAINNAETGILAQAKTDASDKAAVALAEAQKYADDLADNYATAAQGEKADSALQEIEVGTGLTISDKAGNKQTVEIDTDVIFVLNANF